MKEFLSSDTAVLFYAILIMIVLITPHFLALFAEWYRGKQAHWRLLDAKERQANAKVIEARQKEEAALREAGKERCPRCGSTDIEEPGFDYNRYCNSCHLPVNH
jgi:hypothetical protein